MIARLRKIFSCTISFCFSSKWIPLLFVAFVIFIGASLSGCALHIGLLNPKGIIAYEERKLFFDTLALMLIVVLPVIIMSLAFVYHYQKAHHITDYQPNWGHSLFLESLWWGIPCVIIFVLAVLTWKKTHELDPFVRIPGHTQPPLLIKVIALPWKWLFIYPEQNIATINYLVIPVGQQVEYWFTADNVPMSAFFIPQLGSQIYAMAGMRTRLHLLANEEGIYQGINTQFNGDGFSDMNFIVNAVSPDKMQNWVAQMQKTPYHLDNAGYSNLLNPTVNDQPRIFSGVQKNLFEDVIATYMDSLGTTHPRNGQLKFHTETL